GTVTDAATFTFTPDDQGTFVVTLTVTDDDGGAGVARATVFVSGFRPTATINLPAALFEGTPVTLTSTVTDPFSVDSLHYAWTVTRGAAVLVTSTEQTLPFPPEATGAAAARRAGPTRGGAPGRAPRPSPAGTPPPTVEIRGAPANGTTLVGTPVALTSVVRDEGVLDTFTYAWSVT